MATLLLGTTIGGYAAIHAGNIASQSVNYASSAGSVAWSNVTGKPTLLSQFTNDLGNYGSWITASYLDDYTRGSYRVISDYGGNTTWYLRGDGQFVWGRSHDWSYSFRLNLPTGSQNNTTWAYIGQQDSNAASGTWRGLRVRKYNGGSVDGDLSAGAFYIGDTRKDQNWDTAYGWGNHASAGYATTSYVTTQIANLVASAPSTLDTLNELAAALGNDAAFSTTVTTALGNRLRIDTGSQGLNSTQQGYGRTNLGLGSAATYAAGDFALASHNHSGTYLPLGGSWMADFASYGFTRQAGYSVVGGEWVLMSNNAQVSTLIDGSYYAGENGGFYSLNNANNYTSRKGFYNDGTYANFNTPIYVTGDIVTSSAIYPGFNNGASGSQTSYYFYGNTGNSGIRTNGNLLVNSDIYLGTRGQWLSTYLNQNVRTDSSPTFSSVYFGGSQLTTSMVNGLSNMLGVTTLPYSCDIVVNGDPDKFYAVQFWGGDQDVWRRIIIKRGYGEQAPWDPIGTGVHHGGLLLDWEGNFGGWGGAEYADRIRVFNESYTNVCADMFIYSHSMSYVFMLRGGGAIYHLFSDQAINGFYQSGSPDILYSSATLSYDDAWSGTNQYDVYAPAPLGLGQVNSSRIDGLRTKKQSLLDGRYLRQGVDISGIGTITTTNSYATNFMASNAFYLNGQSYYLNSTNGGIYTNARFESASTIHASGGNSSQWNTAYGWGNHASAGYMSIYNGASGADLNTLLTNGVWRTHGGTNSPISGAHATMISAFQLDGNYGWQLSSNSSDSLFFRFKDASFGSWVQLATRSWVTSQNYVPSGRTITINGTSYDLSANRSWTVSATDNTKLPLAGGTMSGRLTLSSISGVSQTVPNDYGAYLHLGGWAVGRTDPSAVLVNTAYRADYADSLFDMNISRFTNNSGYITSSGSISGNAATATYATSATRLYASDSPYRYTDANPYYLYMNYDGGSYWELKVSPATPGTVRVAYANSAGSASTSSQVTVNYNNDSNSTYQLLWGSGNNVYGTSGVYVNPYSDIVYARGGYISPGNPWGTSDSAYFPNGITTANARSWIYGDVYLGNAPTNGQGIEILSNGKLYVRANSSTSSHGYAGLFVDRNSASSNYTPWSFENEYGNHSWGVVARFYIGQSGADRPSIQFANASNNTRWGIGYCYADDNFRITKDLGMAPDGSSGGWGTEYFRINTDGTTLLGIQGNNTNVYGLLRLASNNNLYLDNNYGQTIVGAYSSTRYQGIFAMGDSYKLPIDGSTTGSLYGLAWSHPNAGGVASNLNTHGLLVMENGTFLAAISGSIRARDDVRAPALYDSGSRVAISRGEGRDYVNYSRYVYNNGAYSGTGWVEPSDLGVRYANSAGSASSVAWGNVSGRPTAVSSFSNDSGYLTSGGTIDNARRLYPYGDAIDNTHPGYGLRAWYDWAYSGTYRNGLTLGSHPSDQAYGWQIWQNMWNDRTYTRRYNGGWQSTRTLLTIEDDPYAYNMNQYVRTSDNVSFNRIDVGAVYANNWFRAQGDTGLYQQDYGGHFRRNTNSSHGTWEIFGYAKGGYNGLLIKDDAGYFNNYMHEGGNGGLYCENQGGRWPWYWHRGNTCLGLGNSTTSSSYRVYVNGSLYAEGDIVAYSDARKKSEIVTIDSALEKVKQLRGVYYVRTDETEKGRQTGVIAQEINEVLPEVVTYAADVDEYGVKYGNIVGVLIEAIKEQQKEIEELKAKLN